MVQSMKRGILPPVLTMAEHGEAVMMRDDDHPNQLMPKIECCSDCEGAVLPSLFLCRATASWYRTKILRCEPRC